MKTYNYNNLCSGANITQHFCSTGSLLFAGKHVMLRIKLLLSMRALFVRIELLCSSVRWLSPIRANGIAVFEGSPVW